MTRIARRLFVLAIALLLVGCDHATKLAAHAVLPGHDVDIVRGVLSLQYAENHDTAFSATAAIQSPYKGAALLALAALAVVALAAYGWRRRNLAKTPELLGYALVVAGGVGNLVDRAARGFVIDFIHLRAWPIFNVADVLVVAGGVLLLVDYVRRRRGAPPPLVGGGPRES